MIPVQRSAEIQSIFDTWWEQHGEELKSQFQNYRNKKVKDWIKDERRKELRAFLIKDNDKCVYCERKPNFGGAFIEIEHFLPKKHFPDKVFELNNLLPSCKQCNQTKGSQTNRAGIEILNPIEDDDLNAHLKMMSEDLSLVGVSPRGKGTIRRLGAALNVVNDLDEEGNRYKGARHARLALRKTINFIFEVMADAPAEKLKDHLGKTLKKIDPNEGLTATYAVLILNHPTFKDCLQRLKEHSPDEAAKIEALIETKQIYSLSQTS